MSKEILMAPVMLLNSGFDFKRILFVSLSPPVCSLEDCGVTERGCRFLFLALRSNPVHLTELRLNRNKIQDSGVKMISDLLKETQCKLEKLR